MPVDQDRNGWEGWKTELSKMLVRQGPASLILAAFLYGGWHFGNWLIKEGVPAHLESIQNGYEEIQTGYDKQYERLTQTFEKEQERQTVAAEKQSDAVDRVLDSMERERQVGLENQKMLRVAIEELTKSKGG